MEQLDMVFQAMADPTRRAILSRLTRGSATVNELAEPFDISLPAISRHLKVLDRAGLIRREIEAQQRRCHLNSRGLRQAATWIGHFERFWAEKFDALDDYLDRTNPDDMKENDDDRSKPSHRNEND